ncbi:MAG: hypothetical protein ACKPKO_41245, partial [Candidatus Fonsibacter sp.]
MVVVICQTKTTQSNLTVDNYNRRVGIGTTTPTSTLQVVGSIAATTITTSSTITATSFVRSGGDETQKLDGRRLNF